MEKKATPLSFVGRVANFKHAVKVPATITDVIDSVVPANKKASASNINVPPPPPWMR
jgi:hypothetical protein